MHWSSYNTLFKSERFGPFVYNALSNTLIELDEAHYDLLNRLDREYLPTELPDQEFYNLLRDKLFLVRPGEEEDRLLAQHYQRQAACLDSSSMILTIAPTLRCNFRCPYCFETSQKHGQTMGKKTQERLLDWIRQYKDINRLSVSWYGGEPLLSFGTICDLTERFQALDLEYQNAGLVSNGYLLDQDKISRLNDLQITTIQITLDGPQEIHDSRRFLAGGGPTFVRILDNVANLMESDYAGKCSIRVNVDRNNYQQYLDLRGSLLERFKGTSLSVYPGHVDADQGHSYDHGCCLSTEEWTDFNLGLYREHSVLPHGGLYPRGHTAGMCIANRRNGFVVGPAGELYKCWEDVGKPKMIIGNIHQEKPIANPVLQARYTTGMEAYSDPECRRCQVLPVCGGGCVHKRMRSKLNGESDMLYCAALKKHLTRYLEAYIDALRTKEICSDLLRSGKAEPQNKGFRVISPQVWAQKEEAEQAV
ncbi:MAG: radical SAM protein [Thermodesulfobacteriota bacterium]